MDGPLLDRQTGERDLKYSIRKILADCEDFKNENTHLQVMADALGVIVDFTPKYHCELAGEGIEYTWGFSKNRYRKAEFGRKKRRGTFESLVNEVISREAITKQRVRKFSARARAYILTYLFLHEQQKGRHSGEGDPPEEILLKKEIENLQKKFKTHRCAHDTDNGFLVECEKE